MTETSRRKFIKGTALAGFAACCFSPVETFSTSLTQEPKTQLGAGSVILFQGDSITDGNRGRNNDLNHIMGHGYAFSIASRIGADCYGQDYRFFNRGISGNKVVDLEKRWQTDTLDLKPDMLSILIGVNDSSSVADFWEPVVTIEMFEEVYDRLLRQTREAFPSVLFVLCEPFAIAGSRTNRNWDNYRVDIMKRQNIVRKLAQKYHAVFVGFQEVFDQAIQKAPAEYWIWDGVHPTVAGHELMAREWLKQVEERMLF